MTKIQKKRRKAMAEDLQIKQQKDEKTGETMLGAVRKRASDV